MDLVFLISWGHLVGCILSVFGISCTEPFTSEPNDHDVQVDVPVNRENNRTDENEDEDGDGVVDEQGIMAHVDMAKRIRKCTISLLLLLNVTEDLMTRTPSDRRYSCHRIEPTEFP
jgi:hypothetical protein